MHSAPSGRIPFKEAKGHIGGPTHPLTTAPRGNRGKRKQPGQNFINQMTILREQEQDIVRRGKQQHSRKETARGSVETNGCRHCT